MNFREWKMRGIDLDQPILYKHASFRFFHKKEHHVTRYCKDNVLLLVYGGVLRFSEDGEAVEVHAGEYYIQSKNGGQAGPVASDEPQYLYVHFDAEWTEAPGALAYRGQFDHRLLFELMQRIDTAAHQNEPYSVRQYLLLKLLLSLRPQPEKSPLAKELSAYVEANIRSITSLSDICEAFHYSKNYMICLFDREFGVSPIQYINEVKLRRAMYLLETTSKAMGEIAAECGYADYAYFYKRFVQKVGVNPGQWRRRMQESPAH